MDNIDLDIDNYDVEDISNRILEAVSECIS